MELMNYFQQPSHLLEYQLNFSASKSLLNHFSGAFHPIPVFRQSLPEKRFVVASVSNVFFAPSQYCSRRRPQRDDEHFSPQQENLNDHSDCHHTSTSTTASQAQRKARVMRTRSQWKALRHHRPCNWSLNRNQALGIGILGARALTVPRLKPLNRCEIIFCMLFQKLAACRFR